MFNPINALKNLNPFNVPTDDILFLDDNYEQIDFFNRCGSVDIKPNPVIRTARHPLESGAYVSDHRWIEPTSLDIAMLLISDDYQTVYAMINQYALNATPIKIQTKAFLYENQYISAWSHIENAQVLTGIALNLKTEQSLFSTPEYGIVPKDPSNSTTVSKGQVQPKDTSIEANDQAGLFAAVGRLKK